MSHPLAIHSRAFSPSRSLAASASLSGAPAAPRKELYVFLRKKEGGAHCCRPAARGGLGRYSSPSLSLHLISLSLSLLCALQRKRASQLTVTPFASSLRSENPSEESERGRDSRRRLRRARARGRFREGYFFPFFFFSFSLPWTNFFSLLFFFFYFFYLFLKLPPFLRDAPEKELDGIFGRKCLTKNFIFSRPRKSEG